jgi:GntR family transcriptional repressor for pyruvate dehydrogenase complex
MKTMEQKNTIDRFKPISTRKIYQHILEQFVALVSVGVLTPGDKIPSERELAESLQVSRPSVREALRVLEIIGLVDVHPGGGAYLKELELGPFISIVAPLLFSRDSFDLELLELRELIELRAVELLPDPLPSEALLGLESAIVEMREALRVGDPERGALADIEFHRSLLLASESYILQKVLDLIVTLFEHAVRGGRSMVLEKQEDAQELLQDHERMYEALRINDLQKAKELLGMHLRMVRRLYASV